MLAVHGPVKGSGLRPICLGRFLLPPTFRSHVDECRQDSASFVPILKAIVDAEPTDSALMFNTTVRGIVLRLEPFNPTENELEKLFGREGRKNARPQIRQVRKALNQIAISAAAIDTALEPFREIGLDTKRLGNLIEQRAINHSMGNDNEISRSSIQDSNRVKRLEPRSNKELKAHVLNIQEETENMSNAIMTLKKLMKEEDGYDVSVKEYVGSALEIFGYMCEYIRKNLPPTGYAPLKSTISYVMGLMPS
ncbi:MAG: hypothetical protein WC488_02595 [Candidatus Micrarchaeia archaeon]